MVDRSLSAEDAWPLGVSDFPQIHTALLEVDARWLPDGSLYVVRRLQRGYVDELELWFSRDEGGRPAVRAEGRTLDLPGKHGWPLEDLRGRVAVDRPLALALEQRRLSEPLVIAYDMVGFQSGSDQALRGKLHLPAGAGAAR